MEWLARAWRPAHIGTPVGSVYRTRAGETFQPSFVPSHVLRARTGAIVGALLFVEAGAFAGVAEDGETATRQASPEPEPSWQVNASFSGSRYSLQNAAPTPSTDGTGLDVDFDVRRFFAPLRDDGAPYSLQPFLQRSSSWTLSVDGTHSSTRDPLGGPARTYWAGGISGGLDVYIRRWLIVDAGLGYGRGVLHDEGIDQSNQSFGGHVQMGLRLANTRIDAWYGLTALETAGAFAPLRTRFGASAFSAFAQRVTLSADGTVIPGGASGDVALEYYAKREVGVFAGTFAAKGKLYSNDDVVTRYGGWLGLAVWVDPTLAILAQYQLTLEALPERAVDTTPVGYQEVTHDLLLEAYARFDEL